MNITVTLVTAASQLLNKTPENVRMAIHDAACMNAIGFACVDCDCLVEHILNGIYEVANRQPLEDNTFLVAIRFGDGRVCKLKVGEYHTAAWHAWRNLRDALPGDCVAQLWFYDGECHRLVEPTRIAA